MGSTDGRKKAERKIPKVIILCGGSSPEREVSILSGRNVKNVLESKNVEAELFIWNGEFNDLEKVNSPCFIALHGAPGEDGSVQRHFEEHGIKYTGSDPKACEVTFDKLATKEFFKENGFKTPKWWNSCKKLPCVLKPRYGGSSLGVKLCFVRDECKSNAKEEHFFEEYIDGREISISVVEIKGKIEVLPILEIIPSSTFYNYKSKYKTSGAKLIAPAPLQNEETKMIAIMAKNIYRGLGLRDFARIDGIISKDGIYFLEVNSIPGMTVFSDLPASAKAGRVFMDEIILGALESSLRR
jgi:D-alanine-D-alanine ligase